MVILTVQFHQTYSCTLNIAIHTT